MEELAVEGWSFSKGIVKTASGSCFLECGNTQVLCTVKSPKEFEELLSSEEYIRHSQAILSIKSPMAQHLTTAFNSAVLLESYPKSVIEVSIQVVRGETKLQHLVNAASIALMDAGIRMKDILIATQVGWEESPKVMSESNPLVIGLLVHTEQIALLVQEGCLSLTQTQSMLEAGFDTCKAFANYVKESF